MVSCDDLLACRWMGTIPGQPWIVARDSLTWGAAFWITSEGDRSTTSIAIFILPREIRVSSAPIEPLIVRRRRFHHGTKVPWPWDPAVLSLLLDCWSGISPGLPMAIRYLRSRCDD